MPVLLSLTPTPELLLQAADCGQRPVLGWVARYDKAPVSDVTAVHQDAALHPPPSCQVPVFSPRFPEVKYPLAVSESMWPVEPVMEWRSVPLHQALPMPCLALVLHDVAIVLLEQDRRVRLRRNRFRGGSGRRSDSGSGTDATICG